MESHDSIKPVGIIFLQLRPLSVRRFAIYLDILICRIELAGDIGLYAFVRCDDDLRRSVELQNLRKNETCC